MPDDPIFRVIRRADHFELLIDGGSITFSDDEPIKDLFKSWMRENRLVLKHDKFGCPVKIIVREGNKKVTKT